MSNDAAQGSPLDPPPFTAETLLLLVTGSISAALVPYWLNWLRQMYPALVTHVTVTRSAERFVTVEALRHLVIGEVYRDDWDDANLPKSGHMALEEMAECFGVFPATVHTAMRLANGHCDSPTLYALQTTTKPIAIAPTFPGTNEVIESRMEALRTRPNVVVTGTVPAFSVSKQAWTAGTGFFMPLLLEALERLRQPDADTGV
ncbi:MAG: hypothetical protein K2X36_10340 [Microbacteriaceae bacterium]|nr:hypothetical protein [Microbacteriaceae bacterium]